jgi:hypothetical protein
MVISTDVIVQKNFEICNTVPQQPSSAAVAIDGLQGTVIVPRYFANGQLMIQPREALDAGRRGCMFDRNCNTADTYRRIGSMEHSTTPSHMVREVSFRHTDTVLGCA